MEMRTALGRARGLGSAKEGVGHWWAQRITGVALVPLSVWFVFAAVSLRGTDLADFQLWISDHGNATLMILFTIALFHHAQLGVQVVIEDYVHSERCKIVSVVAAKLLAVVLAISCLVTILRASFGV